MYMHLIISAVIAIPSIQCVPITNSFSKMIELSANDANLKCPSLRISKLFKSEQEFLSRCTSFETAQSITRSQEENVHDLLCLLYYNNFINLCQQSNSYTDPTTALLSDAITDKPSYTLEQVCDSLNNSIYVKDLKPGIDVVQNLFEKNKCGRVCTDFDDNVKLICSLSAYMNEITRKLMDQTQTAILESKSNKGILKPHLTEAGKSQVGDKNNNVGHSGIADNKLTENEQGPMVGKSIDTTLNANLQNQGVQQEQSDIHSEGQLPSHIENSDQNQAQVKEQIKINDGTNQASDTNRPAELEAPSVVDPQEVINEDQLNFAIQQDVSSTKSTVPVSSSTVSIANNNNLNEHVKSETNVETQKESKVHNINIDINKQLGNTKAVQKDNSPVVSQSQNQAGNEKNLENEQNTNDVVSPEQMPAPDEVDQQKESDVKNVQHNEKEDANLPKDDDGVVDFNEQIERQDSEGDIILENDGENGDNNIYEREPKIGGGKTKPAEKSKPREIDEDGSSFAANYQNQNIDDSESYFFSYFMMVCIMFICGYVAYHNKQKILALVVEGRRSRRPSRTRRPNSANYRKLDSNLEEAVTSSCNKNATQVIY